MLAVLIFVPRMWYGVRACRHITTSGRAAYATTAAEDAAAVLVLILLVFVLRLLWY